MKRLALLALLLLPSADAALLTGMVGRGTASGGGGGDTLVFDFSLGIESSTGAPDGLAWQTAYLLNDGRIATFATGQHANNQSNAMRIMDPLMTPGVLTPYDAFAWNQEAASPFWTKETTPADPEHPQTGNLAGFNGWNEYVTNFDNHPSIYLPSDNIVFWVGHGVFDFDVDSWTYGNRSPNTNDDQDYIDLTGTGLVNQAYNPAVAWCEAHDMGIFYANSGGGTGHGFDWLTQIQFDGGGAGGWNDDTTDMGLEELGYARNTAVCVGDYFYVLGYRFQSDNAAFFYKINISTFGSPTLADTLTNPTNDSDEFAQMVYDSTREKFIKIGQELQEYDIATDTWTNISPPGWAGYIQVNGVYHPSLNKIFFRGTPQDGSYGGGADVDGYRWHALTWE